MSETMQVAVLAAAAALLGSFITGLITYLAAVKQRQADRYKRGLQMAYKDIIAFYKLEEAYTQALSTQERSAESVKREYRKTLRENGQDSPSQFATVSECVRRLQDL